MEVAAISATKLEVKSHICIYWIQYNKLWKGNAIGMLLALPPASTLPSMHRTQLLGAVGALPAPTKLMGIPCIM